MTPSSVLSPRKNLNTVTKNRRTPERPDRVARPGDLHGERAGMMCAKHFKEALNQNVCLVYTYVLYLLCSNDISLVMVGSLLIGTLQSGC